MFITSSDIDEKGFIKEACGKRGLTNNIGMPLLSPELTIHEAPKETKSFVLIMDDPDSVSVAGFIWVHWLIANLKEPILPENASQQNDLLIQGKNSWNEDCYGGPAPPDKIHKYIFTIYALDIELDLKTGFTRKTLEEILIRHKEHILGTAILTGFYKN